MKSENNQKAHTLYSQSLVRNTISSSLQHALRQVEKGSLEVLRNRFSLMIMFGKGELKAKNMKEDCLFMNSEYFLTNADFDRVSG